MIHELRCANDAERGARVSRLYCRVADVDGYPCVLAVAVSCLITGHRPAVCPSSRVGRSAASNFVGGGRVGSRGRGLLLFSLSGLPLALLVFT